MAASRVMFMFVVLAVSSCDTTNVKREALWCVGACLHYRASYDDALVEFDLDKIRARRISRKDDET